MDTKIPLLFAKKVKGLSKTISLNSSELWEQSTKHWDIGIVQRNSYILVEVSKPQNDHDKHFRAP